LIIIARCCFFLLWLKRIFQRVT